MKLICEYMVVAPDTSRRQLFTTHEFDDEDSILAFIHSRPGIPSELEFDDTNTLNSRYLPLKPYKVYGCIDYYDRYRYFYLYKD